MIDLLGWGELFLILVIALIVIGPKDLPKLLYTLGFWFQKLKNFGENFRDELETIARLDHLQNFNKESQQNSILRKN